MAATVLVVEDDAAVRRVVRLACEKQGHKVREAATGRDALAALAAACPDIVVLDLMLPDVSGLEVCRQVRRVGNRVPIIVLSARTDEIDVVLGLEVGADDYVMKPFRPRELVARIAAQLRRGQPADRPDDGIGVGSLLIDPARRRVTRGGAEIVVTRTEFDLLVALAREAGRVVSREQLLVAVWGGERRVDPRVVDAHVGNLRRKVEPDADRPSIILSAPGLGYRMVGSRAATGGIAAGVR